MKNTLRSALGIIILLSLFFCGTVQAGNMEPGKEKLGEVLKKFEAYAQENMKPWNIPGMAIAVIKDDKVIYAQGFGVKQIGLSDPVDEKTIFQIGSTSKAFTATLTAMMVDEGKMKWKDKVVDHVPEFRMYDPWVTREFMIEDLLAQHSGMPPYAGDFQSLVGFDRDHIIHSLRYIKPVSSFRSEFAYVNNLFLAAAKAVESRTGKSWEDNIRQRIFKPLAMNDSSMEAAALMNSKNAADPHNIQNGKLTVVPKNLNWPYVYAPAGGINSNIKDMSQWLRLQINDGVIDGQRLVSIENMNFIHTPKTITPPQRGAKKYYCESWVYEDMQPYAMVWHNGGTTGFHSLVAFWPEPKIGMVILTNENNNQLAEALPKYFNDLYFGNAGRDWSKELLAARQKNQEEAELKTPKKPAAPSPALPLEKYTGVYRNEVYHNLAVAQKDNSLTITVGPEKFLLRLTHWDRDTFKFSMPELGDGNDDFVTFTRDAEGKTVQMLIERLNDDGCGVFKRVE